jgi:peroxiredoxin
LQDGLSRIERAGASLVAVSADTDEESAALAEKLALRFPLVSDPDLEVTSAFGLRQAGKDVALPAAYVLDAERRVLWRSVGTSIVERPTLEDLLRSLP